MSVYSINYSSGWYSISPGFAWWHRPVPNVDTIKSSQETERITQKIKREEEEAKQRVDGQTTINVYA